jgi:hypothetical protein
MSRGRENLGGVLQNVPGQAGIDQPGVSNVVKGEDPCDDEKAKGEKTEKA